MDIKNRPLDLIMPYKNNPRINKDAIDKVVASIEEFGFTSPIIVDKNGVIVCGHTRYEAAKKLGMDQVPCIIADDLNDKQIKAFRLIDNKTAELSGWDHLKLQSELEKCKGLEELLIAFGFDEELDFGLDIEDLQLEPSKQFKVCPACGFEFEVE